MLDSGRSVMAKSYAEYSAARRAGLDGADDVAVEVFDRAYALGASLAEARRERGLSRAGRWAWLPPRSNSRRKPIALHDLTEIAAERHLPNGLSRK